METTQRSALQVLLHQEQNGLKNPLANLLATNASHTMFVLDVTSGRFDYMGNHLARQLGYSAELFKNEGVFFVSDIIAAQDYQRLVSNYLGLIKQTEKNVFTQTHRYQDQFNISKADGGYLGIEVLAILYKEKEAGARTCLVGIIQEDKKENYWHRSIEQEKLFVKLQFVISQLECLSNRLMHKTGKNAETVTHREAEILHLLSQGLSTKILASHLHISPHTVESHRKNLLAKFQVKNTAELIKAAYQHIT